MFWFIQLILTWNFCVRCGTIHQFVLDLASLVVRRSMLELLASALGPTYFQAFYSRLNHRSITINQENRVDFETPLIVPLSDSSSEAEEDADGSSAEGVKRKRVIPLPYMVQSETSHTSKRRRKTMASLLGDTEYFVCKHCFKSFNRRSNMVRHIDRTHCERVVFTCPQCPAVYKHAFHFADHLRGHEDEPQFVCESCDKHFSSRNQMRAHVRRRCKERPLKETGSSCRRSRQYDPQPGPSTA
ncbi:zinc finger, C2H2 type, partial [Cooperia oncophora]